VEQTLLMEKKWTRHIGSTELRHGSFLDPKHHNFLISANKILVNNANDIFGSRSSLEGKPTLDAYIAALFASSEPGTIMVTLYPITGYLGRSIEKENEHRKKRNLQESLDASFFTCEQVNLGTGVVSWSHGKEINVWVYSRVHQSDESGDAYFLCDNIHCDAAQNNVATAAVYQCDDGTFLLQDHCAFCGVKRQVMTRGGKKQLVLLDENGSDGDEVDK